MSWGHWDPALGRSINPRNPSLPESGSGGWSPRPRRRRACFLWRPQPLAQAGGPRRPSGQASPMAPALCHLPVLPCMCPVSCSPLRTPCGVEGLPDDLVLTNYIPKDPLPNRCWGSSGSEGRWGCGLLGSSEPDKLPAKLPVEGSQRGGSPPPPRHHKAPAMRIAGELLRARGPGHWARRGSTPRLFPSRPTWARRLRVITAQSSGLPISRPGALGYSRKLRLQEQP